MPPKRKPQASQTSLTTFFPTPTKPPPTGMGMGEVIDVDSEDDVIVLDSPLTVKRTSTVKKEPTSKDVKGKGKRPRDQLTPERDPLFVPSTPSRKRPAQMVALQSPRQNGESSMQVKDESVKAELEGKGAGVDKARARNPFEKPAPKAERRVLDFDVDPLTFRPEQVEVEWGACGGRLPYEVLVESVYLPVGGTRSRLAIGRVLTNFLRLLITHSPNDLLPSIYLLSNHLSPSYIPLELGVGFQILNKAITEVSGVNREGLKRLWDRFGDPGDVAYEAKSNLRTLIRPAPLPAHKLYAQLVTIAQTKGSGAGKIKGDIVKKLLVQVKGEEVRYLVTLLAAMARAFSLTRSATCRPTTAASERYHVTPEELAAVQPIPEKNGKGKGKGKVKEEPDGARQHVEAKLVEATALLRKVYVRHPNYEDILNALLEHGFEDLFGRVPLAVGIPLSPMLGSITRSLNEVYTRLGTLPFTAEAKLDGQRVQIHARISGPTGKPDGGGRWVVDAQNKRRVWGRLFSRHLEDMTEKYPDVCEMVASMLERGLSPVDARAEFPNTPGLTRPNEEMLALWRTESVTSFVMDAEVVAVDKDTGAYRTFQELSNRAKKDVKLEDVKVVVGVFAFDLMLLNDTPLLGQPFSIRRHLLRSLFTPFANPADPTVARFSHVESIDSTKPEDVQAFFEQVVSQKCEGLMVKLLESGEGLTGEDEDIEDGQEGGKKRKAGGTKKPLPSTYEPDARSQGWLKVKKDYLEGMGDSLDLVPIGAWWGLGRKAGWYSPILLGLYNPETGALEAVCKCISGFSDAFYKDLLVRFPPEGSPDKCRKSEPFTYVETGGLRPDLWFEPREVWEIRGADISLSPVYTAAASHLGSERGLSIRFPRFIRRREDKSWEEATTAEQFAEMYRKQSANPTANGSKAVADDAEAEAVSGDEVLDEES
ncbi:hypothetical protein QFC20_007476 [Naganishia adeliensis]|uniref:Uncharacterized protein n=1 Tax=Naganishia adeliensis TaxID=92952 RepID=A0ACC2UYU1_9TREE|nr:hypothetical protein QFC20_007476 [Naganishia adeliensis]